VLDISPLRSSTFRHLAAGSTINEFGNWIADVALAILVFDRTGSALGTAALFLALRLVPAGVGPLLTTRLEVFPARRVLPAVYVIEALIFGAIAAFAHTVPVEVVMVLAALDGMMAIVARALTRGATVVRLKEKDQLRAGNAITNLGFAAGGALGPALAGALVSADGPSAALAVDAASFLVVAVLVATAGDLKLEHHDDAKAFGRLRAGAREVSARPPLRRLLLGSWATLVFAAAAVPIEVVFAKQTLHAGDSGYGLLLTAWGVGLVAGGVTATTAARARLTLVVAASASLIAIGYGGLALAPSLAVACGFSVVGGIGNGIWWNAIVTAIQEAIADEAQSAVMALISSGNQLVPAIGFVLGGIVAAAGSPRLAYGVSAAGVALVVIAGAIRPTRDIDVNHPLVGT
jgi:predicted MFS family arabinose efflux permease